MVEEASVIAEVEEFVRQCLRLSGLEVECRCDMGEDVLNIRLNGEDSGLILRENARLLYSLNHLVNQAFFRKHGGNLNYVVDCEDYRNTRILELRLLAQKAAEKVRISAKPFKLQSMPAGERRVIHLALAEEPGVTTESEGSGAFRRVVILPNH